MMYTNPKRVPCIAREDFYGDALIAQLSFRKNDQLEVDLSGPPQNGWRWGFYDEWQGWLPDWAVEPVPAPPVQYVAYPRVSFTRCKDCIVPMECISEITEKEKENNNNNNNNNKNNNNNNNRDSDGFDQRDNDIFGGNVPRAQTADGNRNEVEEWTSGKTSSHDCADTKDAPSKSKRGNKHKPLFHKSSRVDNADSNNNSNSNSSSCRNTNANANANAKAKAKANPYTQKQDQPEWDGCEIPQITSDEDGRVAVLHADGRTSHYQNENSYRTATNQILEKGSITTKQTGHQLVTKTQAVGRQLSAFRILVPAVSKRKTSSTEANNENNNNNSSSSSSNASDNGNGNGNGNDRGQGPQPKPTNTFSRMRALLPKVTSRHKNLGKPHQSSGGRNPYCDADGKEQTIVEDRRQSSRTTLDIQY